MSWSCLVSVLISLDLQPDGVVVDVDREGVHGRVGGERLGLAGAEIEQRPVARALDGALVGVHLAVGERAVVVRAAVLDGEVLAAAVEDADLEVLPFDELALAGGQLGDGADIDDLWHGAFDAYSYRGDRIYAFSLAGEGAGFTGSPAPA